MPREAPTNVPRGVGSAEPDWSPPKVAVATPGLTVQPEPTQFEKLRAAVLSIGQGAVTGLQAQAQIQGNLDRLRQRALNESDQALRGAEESIQAERINSVKRDMLAIQVEGEDKGPAWMAQTSRTKLANAASLQEQEMWTRMYVAASGAAKQNAAEAERDQEMRIRQQYALSTHTAHNIALQAEQEISLQPELQQELIGSGTGIHTRVQDYLLAEIVAATPDALIINRDDPNAEARRTQRDLLVAAITGYGMKISDGLVNQFSKGRDQLSFQRGIHQVDADLFDFMTKDGNLDQFMESTGATFDENFTHMTEPEKAETMKKRVLETMQLAAQGQFPGRMANMLERGQTLLNMEIDGQPVFTDAEKAGLVGTMLDESRKTAQERLGAEIGALLRQQVIPLSDSEGNYTFTPDPNGLSTLAQPGVNGLSAIDRAANKVLMDMGFLDKSPSDLRPDENLIVESVMIRASEMQSSARSQAVTESRKVQNYTGVMTGRPGGNLNDAYDTAPLTAAWEGRAVTASQAAMNKRLVTAYASAQGGIPESIRQWNGGTIPESTPENRPLRDAILAVEAQQWTRPEVAKEYGLPKGIIDRMFREFTSGDPESFHDALQFATHVRSGAKLEDLIQAMNENGTEIGAALHYAVAAQNGLLGQGVKLDEETIAQNVQAILSAGSLTKFLEAQSPFATSGTGYSNNRIILTSVIQALRAAEPSMFDLADPLAEVDGRPLGEREIEAIFRQGMADGNNMVTAVQQMGASIMATHPDATVETMGSMLYSYLNAVGVSMHLIGNRVVGIEDPQKHLPGHLKDIPSVAREWTQRAYDAPTRDLIQRVMGMDPKDVPVNLADWYQRAYPDIFVSHTWDGMNWDISNGFTPAGAESLHRPASALGGLPITAEAGVDGTPLPMIRTRVETFLPQPDGTVIHVPAGTPITALSQHYQPALLAESTESRSNMEEILFRAEAGAFAPILDKLFGR